MKKYSYLVFAFSLLCLVTLMPGCKKSDSLFIPGESAHFTNQKSGSYFVTGATVSYKIPVGLTTISAANRTVNISVSSPTGAVEGTHYTLSTKSVVIPAGKVVDSITVQGVFAQYLSGRKDTLVFTIVEPGAKASDYNNSFKLLMRGPCFASDINTDLQALVGTYANTNENFGGPYGPYTTTISSATQTSATTANIVITNLYDDNPDWNPLTFTLDWSNLANTKITLVEQVAGGNAANTFGAVYNGMPHGVRPVAAAQGSLVGTFNFCAQQLTLKMQVGIVGVGYSAIIYTVNMAR